MEFGGQLFDTPVICTDPNANDFNESHTQRPDTVIFPRCFFQYSSVDQNQETDCPAPDSCLVHTSVPKPYGQKQNLETATYLRYNDSSSKKSELNTDVETAYEPI